MTIVRDNNYILLSFDEIGYMYFNDILKDMRKKIGCL